MHPAPRRSPLTLLAAALILALTLPLLAVADEPGAATLSAETEQLITHIEAMSEIMSRNVSDCQTMGGALEAFEAQHGDEIQALTRQMSALSPEDEAQLEARYGARLEAAFAIIIQGMVTCADDARVASAMEMFAASEPGADPDLDALPGEVAAQAERLVVAFEEMAALIGRNKSDCDAMAAALEAFADTRVAELERIAAMLNGLDEAADAALADAYGARLEAAAARMAQGLMACADNAAVTAAMARLAP